MFYVKDGNGSFLPLQEDGIFSECPKCKQIHQVDFPVFIECIPTDGCLSGGIWCDECYEQRKKETKPDLRIVRKGE